MSRNTSIIISVQSGPFRGIMSIINSNSNSSNSESEKLKREKGNTEHCTFEFFFSFFLSLVKKQLLHRRMTD